ncbi:MBL fold metallo-hydrolase [Candidatus Bathyarchaeota archaeon]|nr:MBL fold metallo-hydrolase [Candidatus Bathyarchaeota archaeon]
MIDYRITFLGTAASTFSLKRNPTSILVTIRERSILLDCGEGVTSRLLRGKIDINTIDAVFISHGHNDHFVGISSFLWYNWLALRRKHSLEIIAPEYIFQDIDTLLSITHTPRDAFEFPLKRTPLVGDSDATIHPLDLGFPPPLKGEIGISFQTINTIHDPPSRAIRINIDVNDLGGEPRGEASICYTSDTAPSDNIISLAKNCDYLIHEATFLDEDMEKAIQFNHSTPSMAGSIARRAGVKHLVLVHYSNMLEGKETTILEQASREFPKEKIVVASDLDIIRGSM